MTNRFNEEREKYVRRVLVVYKHYAPDTGGIESSLVQQVKWYQEAGYEVSVLCCRKRGIRTLRETRGGASILRCGSLGVFKSMPLLPSFFWHFWRMVVNSEIVHVHLQFPFASFAYCLFGDKLKKRWLVTYHMDVYRQKWLKKLTYPFDRFLLKNAESVMTSSPPLRKNSEILSTMQRDVEIVPFAINDFHKECGAVEEALCKKNPLGFDIKPGYFLFFGRLVEYKGTRPLYSVIRRCAVERPDIRFFIFGDGPDRKLFDTLASDHPQQVTFLGEFVDESWKREFISNSLAVIFPSIYSSEAFGIAQLEAMAYGKPLINCWLSTGVNWVAPEGECAVTVKPNDEQALLKAIVKLNDDAGLRARLGRLAFSRFNDNFTEDTVSAHFKRIVATPC